jgi:hypothetical protein
MATRTISNAGGNYNATTTWVEGIVPTSSDNVVATSTSGQLTVNVNSSCLTIDLTNYTNTLTLSAALNTYGNVITFPSGCTATGNGSIVTLAGVTLKQGATITGSWALYFSSTSTTYTLASNWTTPGTSVFNGTGTILISGTFNYNMGGGLYVGSSLTITPGTGTPTLIFTGTGGWSGSSNSSLRVNTTINMPGQTLTLAASAAYNTGIFTYIAGTIVATGNTFYILATTDLSTGIDLITSWNNIELGGTSSTFNLGANLAMSGALTFAGITALTLTGAFKISCGSISNLNASGCAVTLSGNVVSSGAFTSYLTSTFNGFTISCGGLSILSGTISGSANVVLTGGTWSQVSGLSSLANNLTINSAGVVTISGSVVFTGTKTLTYTAGTVATTGSTLTLIGTPTLNTGGMSWNNVEFGTTQTVTINSLLTAIGTIIIDAGVVVTFGGTAGFYTYGLTILTTTAIKQILGHGLTYTVTGNFAANSSAPNTHGGFVSDSSGNQAIFTLLLGASSNALFFDAIDINSSLGRTVYSFAGVLSNTLNWSTITDLGTINKSFVY